MRRFLPIRQIAFFAALSALWCGSALAAGPPKAVAPNPKYEFRAVLEGKKVSHDFIIRNKGGSVLFIRSVHTG